MDQTDIEGEIEAPGASDAIGSPERVAATAESAAGLEAMHHEGSADAGAHAPAPQPAPHPRRFHESPREVLEDEAWERVDHALGKNFFGKDPEDSIHPEKANG